MRNRLFHFTILVTSALALHAQVDHWESVVLPGDDWSYLVPSSQPANSWVQFTFDDSSWPAGPTGIGYGDGDDATLIDPTISIYLRKQFDIVDISDVESILLDMDYDDGFVAYLNGSEIARSLVSGDVPGFDQPSDGDHEALLYQGQVPERFVVDQGLLKQGSNILAIEVHNRDVNSSDMSAIPTLSLGIISGSANYNPVPDWFKVPGPTVALESSNLPIVIIETSGSQEIPNEPKIPATMIILDNGEGARNYVTDQTNEASWDYNGQIEIEVRGSSSSILDKKQYALTTYDALGEKDNVSLLGMPKENDWILNGLAFDPSLMRDYISYRLSRVIGQYASRGVYCEVILNGDYRGIYVLQEKLKADDNRIDINKIDEMDNSGEELTGGYITKSDKTEGDDFASWEMPNYSGWNTAFIHEHPKPTTVTAAQNEYIKNQFLQLGEQSGNHNSSLLDGYPALIDLPSFIDFMLINELASNADAYQFSTFFHKDRNAKLRAGPVWDFNLTFGNDLFFWGFDRSHTDVWQFYDGDNVGAKFWKDLFDDEVFNCKLGERWSELTQTGAPLHPDQINQLIDEVTGLLAEALPREEARWGTIGDHTAHIQAMKDWTYERVNWLTDHLVTSGNCNADFVPPLVISKINYHPKEIDGLSEKDLEFIEIMNIGPDPVNLTGIYFGGTGLVYQFPAFSTLAPNQRVFLANESLAFEEAYGFKPYDEFSRSLNNGGQSITLLNGFGSIIDEVTYLDEAPWPLEADGEGYYLSVIDPLLDNSDPANWTIELIGELRGELLSTVTLLSPVISLFPNPTREAFTIESPSKIERIRMIDLDGKIILEEHPNAKRFVIPVDGLINGLYLVDIQAHNGHFQRKLVIE